MTNIDIKTMISCYNLVNLPLSASLETVKDMRSKTLQALHPDKHNGCSKMHEQFVAINNAYKKIIENYDDYAGKLLGVQQNVFTCKMAIKDKHKLVYNTVASF